MDGKITELLVDFYYKIGYELFSKQRGLHPMAITYLKLGEKIAPNDPRILFGLGKAFYNGGDQVQGNNIWTEPMLSIQSFATQTKRYK